MTDTDILLQPIPGESACGPDLVFSAEFDLVREARRYDEPGLEQGDWVIDLKEADWPLVARTCEALLRDQTKDIRVAAWLAEAWAKREGFAGLRDGFTLVEGLCRVYWNGLHPLPDDGDVQQRVGNLAWLISRSRQLVAELPLTSSEGGKYGAGVWEGAMQLANAIKRAPQDASELARGKVSLEQFDAARRDTPPAFYSALIADVEGCSRAVDSLDRQLNELLGDEGPSFSALRESLREAADLAGRFARDAGLLVREEAPAAHPVEAASAASRSPAERQEPTMPAFDSVAAGAAAAGVAPVQMGGPMGGPMRGPIQNREQALSQLREVAAFFRRTEPHSPVAYLADKAAGWGEMSLHLWLRTVMKNGQSLADLEEMLGVPKTGAEEA